jgi:two-component system cell cycle sensor histidine kinase/response regulator CckA
MNQIPELAESPKTVFVVEDDPDVAKFICTVLRLNRYNVLSAEGAEEALRCSKAHRGEIHLLLSDLEMPRMNGLELARQLTLDRPEMPVLLMSGFNAGNLAVNEGWHFLPKPFRSSQLLAFVGRVAHPLYAIS